MPNLENASITKAKTVKPKSEIWKSYDVTDGLPAGAICLYQDAAGYLWIGTWGGGVSVFDDREFTTYTTADGLAHNSVVAICNDGGGRLWFGTDGGGVSMYDGQEFVTYTTDDGVGRNEPHLVGRGDGDLSV